MMLQQNQLIVLGPKNLRSTVVPVYVSHTEDVHSQNKFSSSLSSPSRWDSSDDDSLWNKIEVLKRRNSIKRN